MEWGILFTVLSLYSLKFYGFAKEYLKKSEPHGPFQRPIEENRERLMRMAWDNREGPAMADLDDTTARQIARFITALHENDNEALKRGLIPEKVNWKKEGF